MLAQNSDLGLAERGDWKSIASVQRYRKPARYLRRLAERTDQQRAEASLLPRKICAAMARLA